MKQCTLLLLAVIASHFLHAQNVGIGTTTPNTRAILDISSNSKGLLIPRMTGSERTGILFPPNGLMVYDTDKNEFYHYDGNSWKTILNSEYWGRGISTRQRIGNPTDSVGVGTFSPVERFQVNGSQQIQDGVPMLKIKTTAAIISAQEAGIEFNGNLGNLAKILYINSGLELSGRGSSGMFHDLVLKNGNMGIGGIIDPVEKFHLLGNMLVNYADPTIQLQNSGVDKGFIQLNGDDLRLGTYSSNTTGRFVIRTGGNDVVNVRNSGLVSVGVNANASALNSNVIFQVTNSSDKVQIDNTGKVGIGFISNEAILSRLHILNGSDASLTTHGYLMLGPVTGPNIVIDNNEIIARNAGGTASLVLQNDGGSVRIGSATVPAGYTFAVDGKMICEELKVQLSGSWPDYVFSENHKLPGLTELNEFIEKNKHLPNIPSAAQVQKEGIEVGDMQRRMMEKIEELTLYVISLKKEIDSLKK